MLGIQCRLYRHIETGVGIFWGGVVWERIDATNLENKGVYGNEFFLMIKRLKKREAAEWSKKWICFREQHLQRRDFFFFLGKFCETWSPLF